MSQGDPEFGWIRDSGRYQLAEIIAQGTDSTREPGPAPTQGSCFGLVRWGIGSLTHPCLTICESLEASGMHVTIRQQMVGQHGDRLAATRAPETSNLEALLARTVGVARIRSVPMHGAAATAVTLRLGTLNLIGPKLNRCSKAQRSVVYNDKLIRSPRNFVHKSISQRLPLPSRNHAKRYI